MAFFGNEKEWENKVKSLEEKLKNSEAKFLELNDTLEVIKLELQDKDDKIKNSGIEIMELRGDNKTLTNTVKEKEKQIEVLATENAKYKQVIADNKIQIDKYVKINNNNIVDEVLIDAIAGIGKIYTAPSNVYFEVFLKYNVAGNDRIRFTFSPDGDKIKNMYECGLTAEKEYNRIKKSI